MTSISYLHVLNDPEENQKMLFKLPNYLINRWGREVDACISDETAQASESDTPGFPPFSRFCAFLQKEARIACNPVISHPSSRNGGRKFEPQQESRQGTQNRNPPPRQIGVRATGVEEKESGGDHQKQKEQGSTPECPKCKGVHSLETCEDCRRKKTCKTCKGTHSSTLHDPNYVPKQRNRNGEERENPESSVINRIVTKRTQNEASSLIVPVWVHHASDPSQKHLVYALLDDQSDACFVKDSVLEKLSINGFDTQLELNTVLGKDVIKCKKVNGLVFKGLNQTTEISLPRSYSRDSILARRSQIPTPELARTWPHLEQIANELSPHKEDIEVGLLIGNNCARAIRPREIIPRGEDDPYGQRTLLGWGIIGKTVPNAVGESDAHINTIVTTDPAIDGSTCHFVFRTQTKEIISPSQINKMFGQDFVENTAAEEKTLSRDERSFLDQMDSSIRQLQDGRRYFS
ncbi:uncharacterized protein LOC116615632 [Nematostella vectensis]|uniref:uncharacterized protein LOC116615632 n=1 Tax=Nematostella vectensis TaxID=45351 RepID=UPI0020776E69|nr:uncharacterized protein LOC116615632 [Nematostella vectensis]